MGKTNLKNLNKFKLQCGKIVMLQTACSGKSESCILGYVIGTQYFIFDKWVSVSFYIISVTLPPLKHL